VSVAGRLRPALLGLESPAIIGMVTAAIIHLDRGHMYVPRHSVIRTAFQSVDSKSLDLQSPRPFTKTDGGGPCTQYVAPCSRAGASGGIRAALGKASALSHCPRRTLGYPGPAAAKGLSNHEQIRDFLFMNFIIKIRNKHRMSRSSFYIASKLFC
jgi:hypothetical protein